MASTSSLPPVNPLLTRQPAKPKKKKPAKSSKPAPLPALPAVEDDQEDLFAQLDTALAAQEAAKPAWIVKKDPHQTTARERLFDLSQGLRGKLHISVQAGGDRKPSRQELRKTKMAEQLRLLKSNADAEVLAENDNSIKEETESIQKGCTKLGVEIKEIAPDGHCLYSAVADQSNLLHLTETPLDYALTRSLAAKYMRAHPDEFLPYLPSAQATSAEEEDGMMGEEEFGRYCDDVENTVEWGGQPEILALAKSLKVPIHVLQAGTDLVKIGDDDEAGQGDAGRSERRQPILLSYHRKMYGLGEHYNSLVPASASAAPASSTIPVPAL